ncbi:hypothetical protein PR048_026204 [Dryococelus australis]|uniref:PPM-type phosphatase domain-containing protein n=1 Tax=Dryococelus australis TaxID=614101 RepID=A0ABQ9GKN9_9NEOP|nr:hypothetical protein PR048_026204 [Dryococelus australis]
MFCLNCLFQDERKRIESMGGSVLFWDIWRVNGQLAVSRAIGASNLHMVDIALSCSWQYLNADGQKGFSCQVASRSISLDVGCL